MTAKEPFVMTIATHVPENYEPSLLSSQERLESIRVLDILPQARGQVDTCRSGSAKWSWHVVRCWSANFDKKNKRPNKLNTMPKNEEHSIFGVKKFGGT